MEAQEEPATAPAEPAAQTEDKPNDGPAFLGDYCRAMTDKLGAAYEPFQKVIVQ